jgi:hypothetical protein
MISSSRFAPAIAPFAFLGGFVLAQPATAGCGIDPLCYVGQSLGNGASQGIEPFVRVVMEKEAPALIAQFQAAINANIITFADAEKTSQITLQK